MKSKMKHAVSLIVLVVTILVLAIIAAAVIISLSNANIMEQTSQTVFKQDMANYKETYEMYVTNLLADNPTYDRTMLDAAYQNDTNLFIKIFGEVEEKYQKGLNIIEGRLVYDTDDEVEYNILVELNMDVREKLPEVVELEKISKDESYIGYYADIDGDGKIDGVIFADLAHSVSGTWNASDDSSYDSYGEFSYTEVAKDELKDYVVSQESYIAQNGNTKLAYGTRPVLKLADSTTGTKDRFYVMALSDVTSKDTTDNCFTWYDGAFDGGISDWSTKTKEEFGEGKTNTNNMIIAWNKGAEEGGYGLQDNQSGYKDIWGVIQTKVKDGWFVPSRAEWSAFNLAFSLTDSNYLSFGLKWWYWSSSLCSADEAYHLYLDSGSVDYGALIYSSHVRLATTF